MSTPFDYEWGNALPTITTQRLVLRPLTSDDADAVFDIFSDDEVMRYWSTVPMTSREEAVTLLEEIAAFFKNRELFQWGVADRVTNRIVGTCTLFQMVWRHRRAEIGYALNRECWGKGFGREAVGALIDFAFDTLQLERLEADTDPRNHRSRSMLGRLGFRKEGLFRQRWRVGGEVQDGVMLGLLRSERVSKGSDIV